MKAVYSSETLVNSYEIIERHIPEGSILHAFQEQEGKLAVRATLTEFLLIYKNSVRTS
jgi:hypothetical protein